MELKLAEQVPSIQWLCDGCQKPVFEFTINPDKIEQAKQFVASFEKTEDALHCDSCIRMIREARGRYFEQPEDLC